MDSLRSAAQYLREKFSGMGCCPLPSNEEAVGDDEMAPINGAISDMTSIVHYQASQLTEQSPKYGAVTFEFCSPRHSCRAGASGLSGVEPPVNRSVSYDRNLYEMVTINNTPESRLRRQNAIRIRQGQATAEMVHQNPKEPRVAPQITPQQQFRAVYHRELYELQLIWLNNKKEEARRRRLGIPPAKEKAFRELHARLDPQAYGRP